MIDVPVRDHDRPKARIGAVFQAWSGREQTCIRFFSVQRLAEIKEDPFALARQLDAGTADFVGSPPNARPEAVARIPSAIVRRGCQRELSRIFGSKD